ncbi:MAG: hypothetical protein ABSC05_08145 [Candidatus Solibacter sp.]
MSKKSLEIRHFHAFAHQEEPGGAASWAAGVARGGRNEKNGSDIGGWAYNRCPARMAKRKSRVNPPHGDKTDLISISGANLLVAKVVLTNGHDRFPAKVTEQTSTTIRFRLPDVSPGILAIALKMDSSVKLVCCRFFLHIDQQGNFQVDDDYRNKAANHAQAIK